MKFSIFFAFVISVIALASCDDINQKDILKHDVVLKDSIVNLDTLYDKYLVEGSFILFDEKNNQQFIYNAHYLDSAYSPASTFKILNSLIQIEIGTLRDEKEVVKWDGKNRNPIWDQDFDLRDAYKSSTLWFYQELSRRAGKDTMQYFLNRLQYGNQKIGAKVDEFWIDESLKITPRQQLSFLQELNHQTLPFSERTYSIVKNIMIADSSDGVLRAKTGWGMNGTDDVGWYIGYFEKDSKIYYFVNCIHSPGRKLKNEENANMFMNGRIEIVKSVLKKFVR